MEPFRPDPAKSRAVLVGVSTYQDGENYPALPAAEANVRRLGQLLADPDYWGLPAGHCVELVNPGSAELVLDAVYEAKTRAADTVVFYYTGHGSGIEDDLVLTLPRTMYARRRYQGVRYGQISDLLREEGSRNEVVMLDCCYSGLAHTMADPGSHLQAQIGRMPRSTYVLTSSPRDSVSFAPPGATYTAFTGQLLGCLEAGLTDSGEHLRFSDVFRALTVRLRAARFPAPQQSAGGVGTDLAIVRNRSWRGAPTEATAPTDPAGHPTLAPIEAARRPASDDEASGAVFVAERIGRTLGPHGRPVQLVDAHGAEQFPMDALDVAALTHLPTPAQERGVRRIRDLLHRCRTELSDGAGTSALIAASLMDGARSLTALPSTLATGLRVFAGTVTAALLANSRPALADDLADLAVGLTGDPALAPEIRELARLGIPQSLVLHEVGPEGYAVVLPGPLLVPARIVWPEKPVRVPLANPVIAMVAGRLKDQMIGSLRRHAGGAPLVILAERIALTVLGGLRVEATQLLARREAGESGLIVAQLGEDVALRADLGALVGAQPVVGMAGTVLAGRAAECRVDGPGLIIKEPAGDADRIGWALSAAAGALAEARDAEARAEAKARIGRLGCVAPGLRIGEAPASPSYADLRRWNRLRRLPAVLRAAAVGGVIPEGCAALEAVGATLDAHDPLAVVARRALSAPAAALRANARGADPVPLCAATETLVGAVHLAFEATARHLEERAQD
ncbi:hypothetical protein Lfu02_33310 [Longispora fulva]|uniref:Peptidase C14 caspase domain-containing protein n=1 Tax=Longispora fulva TaxID=619741 RepID=A0A8J7KL03_9ACTN|nr:caspase family protein [Longispora fulva]MBG6141885.1 hypothetical protein [Longispora fulva]GIG58959.1 hypothetical protein Lfu02_33310 [Longispora fulva]